MRTLIAAASVGVSLIAAGCGGHPSSWTVSFRGGCPKGQGPCTSSFDALLAENSASGRDARTALDISRRDSALAPLIARPGARLQGRLPWTDLETERPIGVTLQYVFREPIEIHQVLPYVETPPDAPAHATASILTRAGG